MRATKIQFKIYTAADFPLPPAPVEPSFFLYYVFLGACFLIGSCCFLGPSYMASPLLSIKQLTNKTDSTISETTEIVEDLFQKLDIPCTDKEIIVSSTIDSTVVTTAVNALSEIITKA